MFFRSAELLLEFCGGFNIQPAVVLSSPFFKQHSNLNITKRNKVVKACILSYSLRTLISNLSAKQFFRKCIETKLDCILSEMKSYFIDEVENGSTYEILVSKLNSIKFILRFLGYEIRDFSLVNIMRYIKKYSLPSLKISRQGLDENCIIKIWNRVLRFGYKSLSLIQKRTFVMIIFMYATMCRYDCLTGIQLKHLVYNNDIFEICIPRSKTDQAGRGQTVYLTHKPQYSPHRLLCDYIHTFALESENSFLFHPLKWDKSKKEWKSNYSKPLSYSAAYTNFKQFLRFCNVKEDGLSLHSMRIGATTDMMKKGAPDAIIDLRGRWKSTQTKKVYCKPSKIDIYKHVIRYS